MKRWKIERLSHRAIARFDKAQIFNRPITQSQNRTMASDRIVGIDLGTTNSLVAFMQGESPVVIPGDDGLNLLPSVVALDENNQPVIGNAARKYLTETPERAVYSSNA